MIRMNLQDLYRIETTELGLSRRTLLTLLRAHITKVGEVVEMMDEELLKVRGFGEKSLAELKQRLADLNLVGPSDREGCRHLPGLNTEVLNEELLNHAQDFGDLMSQSRAFINNFNDLLRHKMVDPSQYLSEFARLREPLNRALRLSGDSARRLDIQIRNLLRQSVDILSESLVDIKAEEAAKRRDRDFGPAAEALLLYLSNNLDAIDYHELDGLFKLFLHGELLEIARLTYKYGASQKDIAALLDSSQPTVQRQIAQIRKWAPSIQHLLLDKSAAGAKPMRRPKR